MQKVNNLQLNYILISSAIIIILLFNCTSKHQIGLSKHNFEIDGIERNYLLYLPEGLKAESPLVLVLHGYGDSAEGIRNFTRMDSIADQNGFAVCYPEAIIGPDTLRSWNVGYSNYEVSDIGYLKALVPFLQKKYGLSTRNTFCTGMSNGGDMTIQMACLSPDLFKAVAPDVGCLMYWLADSMEIEEVVPIMMINGTKDNITLWEGDEDYPAIGPNGYMGTQQMVDKFVSLNNCKQVIRDTLPDINKTDSSFVVHEKYVDCERGGAVWLYSIIGGGHDWPGAWGNMDFSASEAIWHFFERYVEK